ncbi:MAG: hypothetical protein ISP01_09565 [Methanobrevibacter arboriphilus]|uniref:Uncharacterized protein n=1 Tax=Methanobrevibacter arboriphilus TaxID=39441 RepID=A0A843AQ59_METAZ|nr:hypothetical protein [Methanobrevibacter arboriphilus]MBF4469638.1 hypothetical protein [Methanobrevibacter arboriphilus]
MNDFSRELTSNGDIALVSDEKCILQDVERRLSHYRGSNSIINEEYGTILTDFVSENKMKELGPTEIEFVISQISAVNSVQCDEDFNVTINGSIHYEIGE